jgi:hypothetical protein
VRATLGFLEKLTLRPGEVTPGDADGVLAEGVSRDALVDAIHVAVLFAMIVRLADSLGWRVPPAEAFAARAPAMAASGYALQEISTFGRHGGMSHNA